MDSQAQTLMQSDGHASPVPRRFQFSLRTLFWVVTGCAAASAFASWIGMEASLAIATGVPHTILWGWIVYRMAMETLVGPTSDDLFSRVPFAVTWAAAFFVVVLSTFFVGGGAINVVRWSASPIAFAANIVSGAFMLEIFVGVILMFVCTGVLIYSLVITTIVRAALRLVRCCPNESASQKLAAGVGGFVGGTVVPIVVSVGPSSPNAIAFLLCCVVPGTFGSLVTPLLLVRANRRHSDTVRVYPG